MVGKLAGDEGSLMDLVVTSFEFAIASTLTSCVCDDSLPKLLQF